MEQLRQRMGVVIVGPSGSGKSTLWKILRLALTKLGQSVKQYVMNPKAMPRTQVNNFILFIYRCIFSCIHAYSCWAILILIQENGQMEY